MIVEERIYTLHPGKVPEYMRLYEAEGFAIQGPILGNLVGWYQVDFGPQNQIVHMWGYESYAERDRRRAALGSSEVWHAFLGKIRPLILRQENKTLLPAPWSPGSK
ncbi:MAG: NIPSNAP family protein [Alphaproteobacteria bacterium]|nr:NIPSNAP family protein [Alphaproteobacteria bacterium]